MSSFGPSPVVISACDMIWISYRWGHVFWRLGHHLRFEHCMVWYQIIVGNWEKPTHFNTLHVGSIFLLGQPVSLAAHWNYPDVSNQKHFTICFCLKTCFFSWKKSAGFTHAITCLDYPWLSYKINFPSSSWIDKSPMKTLNSHGATFITIINHY